ncbi:RNA methyltransferase [Sutterella sp.]|uniref:RNA methyltransferase n=1 Tax=Sutterella sp. TaxID=1981025 RepID=UPI0026DF1CA3|nr:RNA methyltransferase [Sutterella sp.]MDO5532247.1 RNA methyltransferase [Sutterella sp.]
MQQTPELTRRVRFILCEPGHPGNIGSAARAIKTMGFRDLRVVCPRIREYRTDPEAVAYATSSVDVLEASRMHETLAEALEGVTFAWALTGYDRQYGPALTPVREAGMKSAAWLDQMEGDLAFVFGTERSGMTNEEILLCQGCAAIPADPASPSLNLAQSVQIAAYEMQMALLSASGHEGELYDWQGRFEGDEPATAESIEGFYGHWEQAMEACGYHNPENPRHLMDMTRRIFSRSGLSKNEIALMRGICAAIIRPKSERIGMKRAKNGGEKA